ncbi:MAG: hypothetical protein F6K24_38450 [Okeania sp. SIO2D1]|nr:hypothetical protein [Okeania sp. SIO2D1]
MTNPFFSGRIPQELLDHVEEYREQTGESKTDVLIKALANYTGYKIPEANNLPKIAPITEKVERLERGLETLRLEVEKLKGKNNRATEKLRTIQETAGEDMPLFKKLENSDNNDNKEGVIEKTIIKDDNSNNKDFEILDTNEVIELLGVSKSSLSQWKSKKLLPKEKSGYIIDFDHSTRKPRKSYWKVSQTKERN